jgi:hypothetical protein
MGQQERAMIIANSSLKGDFEFMLATPLKIASDNHNLIN